MSGTYYGTMTITQTGDDNIDGILTDTAWSGGTLFYSFPTSNSVYNYDSSLDDLPDNFSTISAAQETAIEFALNTSYGPAASAGFSIEGFTNLNVTQDTTPDDVTPEHIRFGQTSSSIVGTARVGDFPGNSETTTSDDNGDVWFGTDSDYRSPEAGNYAWHTHLHEIGHAVGLKHGHNTGSGVGGTTAIPSAFDSMEYSVMTYRSYVNDPLNGSYSNGTWDYAQTYMMLDIAALQHIYGADYTSNDGDTVYSWNEGSGDTLINGAVAIDAGGTKIFATIWDGGGIDTYDLSSYSVGVNVDLRAGEHSEFDAAQLANLGDGNTARGSIFNALMFGGSTASLIENATGGAAADTLRGNELNNVLRGGAGDDTLYGGDGNDTLHADADGATLHGEGGTDYMYAGSGAGSDTSAYGGTGNDYYYGQSVEIENYISMGDGNDYVRVSDAGPHANNDYVGGAGYDSIRWYTISEGGFFDLGAGTAYFVSTAVNLTMSSFEDFTGTTGNDTVTGGSADEVIRGDSGNDTLDGGEGSDNVFGGNGDDLIIDTDSLLVADLYDGGAGIDTLRHDRGWNDGVRFDLATGLQTYNGVTYDTYTGIENLEVGGDATVNGDSNANVLTGLSATGDNLMHGNAGNDTLNGGGGNDELYGDGGDDTLNGGDGNDTLNGGTGRDAVNGGAGDDLIIIAANNYFDDIDGGTGTDTLDLSAVTRSGDTFNFDTGVLTTTYITGGGTATLLGIEIFQDGSGGNTIHSDGTGAFYYGNAGDDTMYAGLGGEYMDGGDGVDTLNMTTWNGYYEINLVTGASNYGGETFLNFENLVLGGGNDLATGTSGVNSIDGGAGNDTIYGGGGNDTIHGGEGNDTLYGEGGTDEMFGDAGDDTIIVGIGEGLDNADGGEGTDTLDYSATDGNVIFDMSAGTFSFSGTIRTATNFEIYRDASGDGVITGSAADDTIYGNGGDDVISGGIGTDMIYGGTGNDTVSVGSGHGLDNADGGDGVDTFDFSATSGGTLSFDMASGVFDYNGHLRAVDAFENYKDGAGNSSIVGTFGENEIYGNGGDDVIRGGGGTDTIFGGAGNDTVILGIGDGLDNADGGDDIDTFDLSEIGNGDVVFYMGSGTFTFDGTARTVTNFEHYNDTDGDGDITGSSADNTIYGNGGDDVIRGGGGVDNIFGGGGNDTVIIGGGDSFDHARGGNGVDTFDLGAVTVGDITFDMAAGTFEFGDNARNVIGFENYIDTTGDGIIGGTDGKNTIRGGDGNDTLDGRTGRDLLTGGTGNDTLIGGGQRDRLNGDRGDDTLKGNAGNDTLKGGKGSDTLIGHAGDDVLNGGIDQDFMDGGSGADRFVFADVADSTTNSTADVIADFLTGTDLIDLSDLIGGTLNFIAGSSFTGTAGEVRAVASGSDVLVRVDADGDGSADMKIVLANIASVDAADFIL